MMREFFKWVWTGLTERRAGRPGSPIRVLVVDDEPVLCRYAGRILKERDIEVTLAFGPEEAVAAARRGEFDLLLTDVKMPGMDGDTLAVALKQDRPDLRVLYVTGAADRLFENRLSLDDGEAYIEKPYSGRALSQAVSLLLFGTIELPMVKSPA